MAQPDLTVQTNEDSFLQNLGSMDQNQLEALLNEINNRQGYRFGITDPRNGKGPTVNAGAFQDPTKEFGTDLSGIAQTIFKGASLSHQYRSIGKRSADKKKMEAYRRALRAESARQKSLLGERAKSVQNQIRTLGLRDKVNQQFRDMELEGLFDRVVKQGQDQAALGIAQQHEDLTRETGFGTIARGLGGSSVDADRIADIQASQDQALAKSAAQAQQQRTSLGQNLDQQRRSLLSSVSGANPGEEARLQGQLSQVQNQAGNAAQQAGQSIYGMGIQQEGLAGQSQAIGGLLSTYANLYNQDRNY